MSYFSLHNHDCIGSILDGLSLPSELLDTAVKKGLKGFCITNHGNLLSLGYYQKLKSKYPSLKISYGVEFYEIDKNGKYFHLIVIPRNFEGYKQMNRIVSESSLGDNFYYKPRISISSFRGIGHNFVVTSACLASRIARASSDERREHIINKYKTIFPHFYLEMQSHVHEEQVEYNKSLLKLSKKTDVPFVITTDSHFCNEEDAETHAYFVNINRKGNVEGTKEIYSGCYIQTSDEIHSIMDEQIGSENVKIGLQETLNIMELIEDYDIFQEPTLPIMGDNELNEFRGLIIEGARKRGISLKDNKVYADRVKMESKVITKMGFIGYFLLVAEMIGWAKDNNVMVGVGRGSAVSSLINYFLGITDVDPIKYDLIFERFLNEQRVSLPDCDSDLSDKNKIIEHFLNKYGADRISQTLNLSYFTPKVSINDCAKLLREDGTYQFLSIAETKQISDCFGDNFELGYENLSNDIKKKYPKLFSLASKINGRVKTTSIHAGGVHLAKGTTYDHVSTMKGKGGEVVAQADKKMVEELGLVKIDLLGLKTLRILKDTLNMIGKDEWYIHPDNDEFMNDQAVYESIWGGNLDFIFQLSEREARNLSMEIRPKNILDLSDITALIRPDAMRFINQYKAVRLGKEKAEYIHEDMEGITGGTHSVLIYQEQLLQMIRKFGDYSYAEADIVRRVIAKKRLDEVQEQAVKFKGNVLRNGYSEKIAQELFEYMEKIGGYSFNKSHSVAYSVISYQTMYMKYYHPVEFMTAMLNEDIDKQDKLITLLSACSQMGIKVLPPRLNKSKSNFSTDGINIYIGMNSIKNVSKTVVEDIISKYPIDNPMEMLSEMKVDKSSVIGLVKSGYFGDENKIEFLKEYFKTVYIPTKWAKPKTVPTKKKFGELFGDEKVDFGKEEKIEIYSNYKKELYNKKEEIRFKKGYDGFISKLINTPSNQWQFESIGIFLGENPFDNLGLSKVENIKNGCTGVIGGVVTKVTKKISNKGKMFMWVTINTHVGNIYKVIAYTNIVNEYKDILKNGEFLIFKVKKSDDGGLIGISKVKKLSEYN